MRSLRSHLWVALLFCLISVGQAYPYSYGWSVSKETVCSCRQSGHDCVHGCPRKSRAASEARRAHHGHRAEPEQVRTATSADLSVPKIAKRPCGASASQEVLSFRGDPFLPALYVFSIQSLELTRVADPAIELPSVFFVPETPPPRLG